jgi:riboflavin synthase
MFTGIIEATVPVRTRTERTLAVGCPPSFTDLRLGMSIAINGVCLTITKFDQAFIAFDVIPITWERSNLGQLQPGDEVNVERAMRADGRFDGHIVQGHAEGVGTIMDCHVNTEWTTLTISVPLELMKYVIPRGSITLDGVALTVMEKKTTEITVGIIPTTLKETTLGQAQVGRTVNIETDVIGRYVMQMADNK